MTAHIGIVACSAEGAALCYRTLCHEGAALFGVDGHPRITLHGESLADYVACLEAQDGAGADAADWQGVAELMLASANALAAAGADFLICPDNTIHAALPLVEPRSPLPWLHIAEAVADAAAARGLTRLGLLGTRWLVDSDVYPDRLGARGIACVRPAPDERVRIDRIIMEELVRGEFRPESVAAHIAVVERMKAAGCDGVVLGCTEIPLILDDANSPLPTLDSTRLLARAALRRAASS